MRGKHVRESLGNERHLHVCVPNTRLRFRITKLIPDHWQWGKSSQFTQGLFWQKSGPSLCILDFSCYNLAGLTHSFRISLTLIFWSNGEDISLFDGTSPQIFANSFYNCLLSFFFFFPLAKHIQFLPSWKMWGYKLNMLVFQMRAHQTRIW